MSIYLNFGNGADGNVTISSNFNCHTGISIAGKSYADAISYNVDSLGSNSVHTTAVPNGIVVGDEVLLITLEGSPGNYNNVGNYETLRVQNVSGSTITFTTSKTKLYGQNGGDTVGAHKIVVQRIPNYNNLTINNGINYTCSAWEGNKYGVIFFRVKTEFINNGNVVCSYLGYRGGVCSTGNSSGSYGFPGESICNNFIAVPTAPNWTSTRNIGGGGGDNSIGGGGGAGYGTVGAVNSGGGNPTEPGTTYGINTLTSLYLGSGGGSGYTALGEPHTGHGGRGGGIITIMASVIKNYGTIVNLGQPGLDGYSNHDGGGGSGGSVMIQAGTIYSYSSSITATGGSGLQGNNGGVGRTAIYYKLLGNSLTNVSPAPYTSTDVIPPYRISGTLTDPADLYLFKEADGAYQEKITAPGLTYEFRVTDEAYYMVVAKPADINKAAAVYTRIQPVIT